MNLSISFVYMGACSVPVYVLTSYGINVNNKLVLNMFEKIRNFSLKRVI